jgi:transcriptional regulator with XRE-family HTH domain
LHEQSRETDLLILGSALRALRAEAGLTQEQLAERIGGIDAGYVSRLERGHRGMQWLTVKRFLVAMGANMHQLADALEKAEAEFGQ